MSAGDDPGGGADASAALDADRDAAARGSLYALLASLFEEPDDDLYAAIDDGRLRGEIERLVGETDLPVAVPPLTTDDDPSTLRARYNDLFELGYAQYRDRTDGTLDAEGPPVPLHEAAYRSDVSWNDVNLDLARAYDYYGLRVDQDEREHHDHLRLQLEFAGYLARREAAVEDDAAAARLDFLDRHLRVIAEGVAGAVADEPGTDLYGDVAALLVDVVAADREDLAARTEGGSG